MKLKNSGYIVKSIPILSSPTQANRPIEKLLVDGEEYAQVVLDLIHSSQKRIEISCYRIRDDIFGCKVLEALQERVRAGVKVRLILDGYGSLEWLQNNIHHLDSESFSIRVFHPLPWPLASFKWQLLPRLDLFFKLFMSINRRNHHKLHIFDGKLAILGSRNINDDVVNWRETSILISGANNIHDLERIFQDVWSLCHDRLYKRLLSRLKKSPNLKSNNIISNHRYKLRKKRNNILFRKIDLAQHHVFLTTPYFFPTLRLLNAIRKKAMQGVDIRILLPQSSDVWISKLMAQIHYQYFLDSGVKIYEYQPEVLHAKTLLIDDWALVGSSNFNQRSTLRDIEIDYCPSHPETIRQLEKQFYQDLEKAVVVKSVQPLSLWQRLIAEIFSKSFPSWF